MYSAERKSESPESKVLKSVGAILMTTNNKLQTTNSPRGFTVLEILIVISILGILMAVVVPSFTTFRSNSILNTETQEILTIVNKARISSMSSRGDLQYGIRFEATRIVLFSVPYSEGASTNEVHIFNPALTLSPITINGGGSDVLFIKFIGSTNQNATTTLSIIGSTSASSTVIIRPSGVATIK